MFNESRRWVATLLVVDFVRRTEISMQDRARLEATVFSSVPYAKLFSLVSRYSSDTSENRIARMNSRYLRRGFNCRRPV